MSKRIFQYILPFIIASTITAQGFAADSNSATATVAATPVIQKAASNALVATPTLPAATNNAMPTVDRGPAIIPQAPNLDVHGYVLMDEDTGMIIAHKNMHVIMQPASLTKLMTLYLTFQALANKQIHLTDEVTVSKHAWQAGGSRMFIQAGTKVSVKKLIEGVIVASGNDAATQLAEYVGGNQPTFVEMMNATAQRLGMKSTHYDDPTGLPAPGHHTTPYDMALLTHAIIATYPQYYHFFHQGWINYDNIKQQNRNHLMWTDSSVDGLKTGFTKEAGHCLISSALRKGMRLISVVMGAPTGDIRNNSSEALLNWGFRYYQTHKLFDANQTLANPRVWLGQSKTIPVGLASTLYVTIPAGSYANLTPVLNINKALRAPIAKGETVGTLAIRDHKNIVITVPLIALQSDASGGLVSRAWDHVVMFF